MILLTLLSLVSTFDSAFTASRKRKADESNGAGSGSAKCAKNEKEEKEEKPAAPDQEEGSACGICLDAEGEFDKSLETMAITLPCNANAQNHTFHLTCIRDWFHIQTTCPLCKTLHLPTTLPALEQTKAAELITAMIKADNVEFINAHLPSIILSNIHYFHLAVEHKATKIVDLLLKMSPLKITNQHGEDKIVEKELTKGDNKGMCPVHHALRNNDIKMAYKLLFKKPDVLRKPYKKREFFLLQDLIPYNNPETNELFKQIAAPLAKEYDFNSPIGSGGSPALMYYAVRYGNLFVVDLLLEQEYLWNQENDYDDAWNEIRLHNSIHGHLLYRRDKEEPSTFALAIIHGIDANKTRKAILQRLLHVALRHNSSDVYRCALQTFSVILYSVEQEGILAEQEDILERLIAVCKEIKYPIEKCVLYHDNVNDFFDRTLSYRSYQLLFQAAPALISAQFWSVSAPTLLFKFVQLNRVDLVKLILTYKPDVNQQNGAGKTVLHVAGECEIKEAQDAWNRDEIQALLLQAGAQEMQDRYGHMPKIAAGVRKKVADARRICPRLFRYFIW